MIAIAIALLNVGKALDINVISTLQWRMQDFLKGSSIIKSRAKRVQNFRSHAHFGLKPRPFSLVVARNSLPYLSIDLFLIENAAKTC